MILSFALWAGLFAVPLALLLLIPRRTRRFSAPLALLGIAMIAIAVAWPVTEQRVVSHPTHLDQIMPVWQFSERHAIHVALLGGMADDGAEGGAHRLISAR